MQPTEAAKLLELPDNATPDQVEARFNELRARLEDKIAKAPTPGLKAKYRETLDEITAAFETLTLAADSSALPVLKKEAGDGRPAAGKTSAGGAATPPRGPSAQTQDPRPSAARKSGGREFALVAVIAVAVLGAGGWFVIKTRAENAEQARLAAEAQAEAVRQAEAEKARIAEERRLAEEEKARTAAEARTEQERLDRLTGQLRGELAGFKVEWEAFEKEEDNAERRLSELKSDLRSLRDATASQLAETRALVAAQQDYFDWLADTLPRHPAKIARSKAEELLSARQPDEAQAAMGGLQASMNELEKLIRQRREQATDLDGELVLRTERNVNWTLTDAFGRTRSGEGPVRLDNVAVGPGRIRLAKPHWPVREERFHIRREEPVEIAGMHQSHALKLRSTPAEAEVRLADGTVLGRTPLEVDGFPPGALTVTLHQEGYYDQRVELTLPIMEPDGPELALKLKPAGLVKPGRWSGPNRVSVDMRSMMSGSSNSNTQAVEEWDLSKPDGQGGWQQIVRKLTSRTGVDRTHTPVDGSIMRQQRQPDGKWTGEFTQGGLPGGTHNSIWTSIAPSLWLVSLGGMDIWPEAEVPVGGTWSVKPGVFFSMIGLANATGNVTGKVLSLDREGDEERAVIEFSYNYSISGMTGQDTLKLQLNLTDCYVTRAEGRGSLQHSGGHISSSYTTTVTRR